MNPVKTRQDHIDFHRNYCVHYDPQPGKPKVGCKAGCDIEAIRIHPTGKKGIKWGPCIGGHELEDPLKACPKWERRSLESAEARADSIERTIKKMTIAGPFIAAWRKKEPFGKSEVVECPVCKGQLSLSQSSYNGHVRACCSTADCINFIE